MIKVKYIPCLFEETCREMETHNTGLLAVLKSFLRGYPDLQSDHGEGLSVRVNGKKISPFRWSKTELEDGDQVTIVQEVGLEEIIIAFSSITGITFAAGSAATAATLSSILSVALIVISIASTIYSLATQSKPDRQGGLPNSPTYGWEGVQMQVQQGAPVPVIYGQHLVGGTVLACNITTDGQNNFLNLLIGLAEGEIEGIMKEDLSGVCGSLSDVPAIFINGNPFSNYGGMDWNWRAGLESQALMPGFSQTIIPYNVANIKIAQGETYIYPTVGSNVEGFELQFMTPSIYGQFHGNYFPLTIIADIYYCIHGTSTWILADRVEISGASLNPIRQYYRKDGLTAGQYDIKVYCVQAYEAGTNGGGMLYLSIVEEIKHDATTYPFTALLSLSVMATDKLSGSIPNITTLIRGKKVKNLNTSVVAWSQNPLWCVADFIMAARYGLGRYITQANLNVDRFIEEANWCDNVVGDGTSRAHDSVTSTSLTDSDFDFTNVIDEWGNTVSAIGRTISCKAPGDSTVYTNMVITSLTGSHQANGSGGWTNGTPSDLHWEWGEKRMLLDIVLDQADRAFSMVGTLCASFRGTPLWSQDAIEIVIDRKKSPSYIFNDGNVLAGSFTDSFASEKTLPTVVELSFADRLQNYQMNTMAVDDKEAFIAVGPRRMRKFPLIGAVRTSQIYREGRWHLRAARLQDETVSFRTGIDAAVLTPGDVITYQSEAMGWSSGGRIVAATINSITIDQEFQLVAGKTYYIQIIQPAAGGTEVIEQCTITNGPGFYNTVNVTPNWSAIPQVFGKYRIWESTLAAKTFVLVERSRTPQFEVQWKATEYLDAVHADTDIILPAIPATSLPNPNIIADVTNLAVAEGGNVLGDGTWSIFLELSFMKPESPSLISWDHAEVYVAPINPSYPEYFQYYGKTDKLYGYRIDSQPYLNVGETVKIKVVSVSKNGIRSSWETAPTVQILIQGKLTGPSDVTSFNASQIGSAIQFTWQNVSDRDIDYFEIREGPSWATAQTIAAIIKGTSYTLNNFMAGVKNYLIKGYDRSGNPSINPASCGITVTGSSFQVTVLTKDMLLDGTLSNLMFQYALFGFFKLASLKPSQGWDDGDTITGGTATADGFNGGFGPSYAFDSDPASHWEFTASYPHWIKYDYGAGNEKVIKEYVFNVYDDPNYYGRMPNTWTVEGSHNDSNWTPLDSRSGQTFVGGIYAYHFANTTTYRYYRLSATVGNDSGIIRMGDIELKVPYQWDDASYWDIPISPTSGYLESAVIDLGSIMTVLALLNQSYILDGDGTAQTITVEIKQSNDGSSWSAYAAFVAGQFTCRYLQFKISLSTLDATENAFISQFQVQCGLPKNISLTFPNVTIVAGGTTVAFGYTFQNVPVVKVTPIGSTPLVPQNITPGLSSAVLKLFNLAGTSVGGNADVSVEGF